MGKKYKIAWMILILVGLVFFGALYIIGANSEILNPKGIVGHQQRDVIVWSTWLMLIVVMPVLIMTAVIAWKYRARNSKATYHPEWDYSLLAESLWWGIPFIIIFLLSILVWKSSYELDPFKNLDSEKKSLKVQVVSLQWQWLFIYPEQGVASLNYLQFPVNTSIDFEITADSPMNSFWIPELGGQVYSMPGMKSELHLAAQEVGVYQGSSAHYSGKNFSNMVFPASSTTQEEFETWVNQIKISSELLGMEEYNELAKPNENNSIQTYVLGEPDLYDQIVMKYMMPMQGNQ